ncbi:hypothetical protein E0493_20095 [Roseomonas sp. M0104]|uniref:Uncharacterized protein n=1 Tax=Teichococcus coralli TaxID=2545983 RepID=A0A845BF91_9PROT|nr:hypothetical protein [Pseudoroseomonas coralli]MXP65655.1 hypothetical protein [Pseudoroseomonas coralli]
MTPLPRPSLSAETLPARGNIESPMVALFEDACSASAALRRAGLTRWRQSSPGVVVLAPLPGLREQLYAAGALLVVE